MLAIPLEKLAYSIVKAREYEAEVPPVDVQSGSNPTDDIERDILEDRPDNPTAQELIDAIEGLSEAQRIELLALMWLGRGDYGKQEWREALAEAVRVHDAKEADYFAGTPLLAAYLEAGLDELGYSISDYEAGRL